MIGDDVLAQHKDVRKEHLHVCLCTRAVTMLKRRTIWAVLCLGLCFIFYFGAYCATKPFHRPAANMAYFGYADSPGVDKVFYYAFYPAYRFDWILHRNNFCKH